LHTSFPNYTSSKYHKSWKTQPNLRKVDQSSLVKFRVTGVISLAQDIANLKQPPETIHTSAIFVQDIVDIGAVAAANDELLQLLGSRKIAIIATFCPILVRTASSELHQIFNDTSILAILRLPRRYKSASFPAPRSTMYCTNIPDVCHFRPLFQICDILCYRAFRYIRYISLVTISLCYFCFR